MRKYVHSYSAVTIRVVKTVSFSKHDGWHEWQGEGPNRWASFTIREPSWTTPIFRLVAIHECGKMDEISIRFLLYALIITLNSKVHKGSRMKIMLRLFFILYQKLISDYFDMAFWHLKSDNLQYNTLGCWVDGTNVSLTKRLMLQVLFFFIVSCKILWKNPFNLFLYFFITLQK